MRRFLLDTHVVIWLLAGARTRIPASVQALLQDKDTCIAVSAINVLEIAIKRSRGRLTIPDRWPAAVGALGFDSMPVTAWQAAAVQDLPFHHSDPFDRLLVAQAQTERCALVTADAQLAAYDVEVVWG